MIPDPAIIPIFIKDVQGSDEQVKYSEYSVLHSWKGLFVDPRALHSHLAVEQPPESDLTSDATVLFSPLSFSIPIYGQECSDGNKIGMLFYPQERLAYAHCLAGVAIPSHSHIRELKRPEPSQVSSKLPLCIKPLSSHRTLSKSDGNSFATERFISAKRRSRFSTPGLRSFSLIA